MKTLNLLIILTFFIGCVQETNKSKTSKTTTTNTASTGTTDTGGTDTGTDDPGDDGDGNGNETSPVDFYRINSPYITMHGQAHYAEKPSRIGPNNEVIMWSSETDLQGINDNIFITDSKFNMRLIARNSGASIDSQGNSCSFNWQPFQKLQVEVRIRKKDSAYGYNHVFDNLQLDQESKVKEFQVPLNTNDPLVIEILRVKWDYTCSYYTSQGYGNYPGYCPWDDVWKNDCVALEMQVSTDYTNDIPGDRY